MNLKSFFSHRAARVGLLAMSSIIAGCQSADDPPSTDLEFISRQIDLNIPSKGGKWEIFQTPENARLTIPGPTDYETLIAELEKVAPSWTANLPAPATQVLVVPEIVRPWLSSTSKALLRRAGSGRIKLAPSDNCHHHSARVRSSGRVLEGFTCTHGTRVLLYLTLTQPSM